MNHKQNRLKSCTNFMNNFEIRKCLITFVFGKRGMTVDYK